MKSKNMKKVALAHALPVILKCACAKNYGNSGGNSGAIQGNSQTFSAIRVPGEGLKCESGGNSRPVKFAFIKLKVCLLQNMCDGVNVRFSHCVSVPLFVSASRILPRSLSCMKPSK